MMIRLGGNVQKRLGGNCCFVLFSWYCSGEEVRTGTRDNLTYVSGDARLNLGWLKSTIRCQSYPEFPSSNATTVRRSFPSAHFELGNADPAIFGLGCCRLAVGPLPDYHILALVLPRPSCILDRFHEE